jgi:hypothetical protein
MPLAVSDGVDAIALQSGVEEIERGEESSREALAGTDVDLLQESLPVGDVEVGGEESTSGGFCCVSESLQHRKLWSNGELLRCGGRKSHRQRTSGW